MKKLKDDIDNFFKIEEKRKDFKDLVKRLYDKLKIVIENKEINSNNILNSIKLEFKPGLFTSAILSGNSLDLRNFDKIPTTTLERFNELFTGMRTLTLNEDRFNTLTTQDNKLICKTVDFIRFFATSLTKNFSEAVLSRWTVINTKEYEFEELEEVLQIYRSENQLNTLTSNDIKYLIGIARFFKMNFNKTISIKLLINAIELLNEMNKNLGEEDSTKKQIEYYINRQFIYYVTLKSIIEYNCSNDSLSYKEINDKLYQYLFEYDKDNQIQIDFLWNKITYNKCFYSL